MSFTVTEVPERERFEARDDDGALAGVVTYQLTGSIIAYTHTKVEPAYEHQGLGSTLARTVMEDAKAKNRSVVPICPFLKDWLDQHQEFDAIVVRNTRKMK